MSTPPSPASWAFAGIATACSLALSSCNEQRGVQLGDLRLELAGPMPVAFTAFVMDRQGQAEPLYCGVIGTGVGEAKTTTAPQADQSLRLRFTALTDSELKLGGVRMPAHTGIMISPIGIPEFELDSNSAEYIYRGGNRTLSVGTENGKVTVEEKP